MRLIPLFPALLLLTGCLHTGTTIPIEPPPLPAPSIKEETKSVEDANKRIKEAAKDIQKASEAGRERVPELVEWNSIDAGAGKVFIASAELDNTVTSLKSDDKALSDYKKQTDNLVQDKAALIKELEDLKQSQSRKALMRLALAGSALIGIGVLLVWVDRKWALMAGASGAAMLALSRVLIRVLILVDTVISVAMFLLPLAVIGWLVWRYRKHITDLVKSVQQAKGAVPEEAREGFRAELEKVQDTATKKEVARIKKKLVPAVSV